MSDYVPQTKRAKHSDGHDKENDSSSTVSTATASKASEGGILADQNKSFTASASLTNSGGNMSNEGGWDGDDENGLGDGGSRSDDEMTADSFVSTGSDNSGTDANSVENADTVLEDEDESDGDTCESETTIEYSENTSSAYEPSSSSGSDVSTTSSSSSSSTSEDEDDLTDYNLAATDKYYQCGSANMPRRR